MQLPEIYNMTTTFLDDVVARGLGKKTALYFNKDKINYETVLEMVNRTGNALKELGVEMEDRVMLLLPDMPEFVYSFLGTVRIGAIAVPVSTAMRPHDYIFLLNDSRAKLLITEGEFIPIIERIGEELRHLKGVVVRDGPDKYPSFEELISQASPHLEPAETSKDDMAFWMYTSGSTGMPKAVVHLHHDWIYCCDTVGREVFDFREGDTSFSASKLFFAYGLGNSLFFPFRVGASSVLYPHRMTAEVAFELIDRYRPTHFFAVPTLYARMLQVEGAERRYDLSSVRLFISSAEVLPPAIFQRWKERFGKELLDVVGSTENLAQFIANRPGMVRPGSSGLVVPGYEAKIVDDEGKEVAPGHVGHLLIKGESSAPFYWNRHQATKKAMLGEWLKTGDMFYRDEEGYFYFCGRSDDVMKVSGCWVSPIEVENALTEHPAVLEAAVSAAADSDGLIKPRAYVVLKDGFQPSAGLEEEIKGFVKERLAPFKYPRWIEFVPELPKTATGKIQRFRLRGS